MKWGLKKRDLDSDFGIDSFRKDISRVFDDFFSLRPGALFDSKWVPSVDVKEDEKAIHVTAEMPGMNEKDLNVTLENNVLSISGEKNEEREEKDDKKKYVVSERRYGSFQRSISLPNHIKGDKIKAKFKNGVLNIEIPKDGSAQQKKIQISVN